MKSRTFLKTLLSSLFILIIFATFIACEKKDEANNNTGNNTNTSNTIKIGQYGSLTGDKATFGQSTKKGIDLALDEANKSGGLLGKQIEMIIEDNRGLQQEATTVVQKLIDKDKVIAVLGEVASTNSIAGGQVCQEKKIPMVSPSSTNPQVTQVGDYIFRVCFLDDFQGEVMAKFAANTLKVKKVAILHDNGSDYSKGLSQFFAETFKKLGGEILVDEAYQAADSDFSAQLTKIKGLNPEAIYVPGYYTQVGQIAQQARKTGITVPLMGGDGWDSQTLFDIGKDALNGCFISNHYTIEDPDPNVQSFITNFKAKFNETPDALAALAYDAARILFDAIKRANSTDPKAIRDALAQTKEFKAVTGVITISPTRDAVKSAVVLEIQNGKYKYRETIKPDAAPAQSAAVTTK
ncbi:MAG: ABC transporter substrate-binding protein [Blastocatellia bacterium]|nr:ABC transporter substrate-binding protein [Blastocatellia bacterium]MBL8195098.1 ABC transporter substrate-binding protein [Blastocatellia bacterium]MBN8721620.1 ABC transporter substrate-binding protein [Acidobacteriota bacterium]